MNPGRGGGGGFCSGDRRAGNGEVQSPTNVEPVRDKRLRIV